MSLLGKFRSKRRHKPVTASKAYCVRAEIDHMRMLVREGIWTEKEFADAYRKRFGDERA